jgi:hypothetical protein
LNDAAVGAIFLRTSGANGLIFDHLILLSFENLPKRWLRGSRPA